MDSTIKRAENLCSLALAYRMVGIDENDNGAVRLEDGTVLSGKALSKMLSQSQKAVLMASTAGSHIMEEIRTLMDSGKASEAVIMDAAASEIADAGLVFDGLYRNIFEKAGQGSYQAQVQSRIRRL